MTQGLCLITGANGFIGQHLRKLFNARNIPYKASVRHPQSAEDFEVKDLMNFQDWDSLLKDCTSVVHLAAKAHDTGTVSLDQYRKSNTKLALQVAQEAKKRGIRRFIFISTIKVNGEYTDDRPFTADDQPNPQDAYGLSKYETEQRLMFMHEPGVFEVVIIRPPLIYGAGVKANFKSLIGSVRSRLPLPFGSVQNKRSLVSADNLTDLIAVCLNHPGAAGEIFLVSDGADLSLPQIINGISSALKITPWMFSVPTKLMNLLTTLFNKRDFQAKLFSNLQVDIEKTRRSLGWNPPYTTAQAMEKMFHS